MPVRWWIAVGLLLLGLSLAVLSRSPPLEAKSAGQAILAAPYVSFALLAGLSSRWKAALVLSGVCLVLHLRLMQQLAKPEGGMVDLGSLLSLGALGPGLLLLVALIMLIARRND